MKREQLQNEIKNALECPTAAQYIADLGWCEWMEEFAVGDDATQIVAVMENIHWLAHATIDDVRKKAGLTQAAFSKKMGIPRRTIETWAAKKTTGPFYVKLGIAEALGQVNFKLKL